MAIISPAILTNDPLDLQKKLLLISKFTDRCQIDVIDGCFVNNKTVLPKQIEPLNQIKMDFHLMVCNPLEMIDDCLKIRPNLIIVQYEIKKDIKEIIDRIIGRGVKVGIAINPNTSINEVSPLLNSIDHLLVMSYSAGFSGQKFEENNLFKAHEARKINKNLEIGLDGGVNLQNISLIAKRGFDVINVNSTIFNADNPSKSYNNLRKIANEQ